MSTRARSFEGFLRGRRQARPAAEPRCLVAACAAAVRLAWDAGGPELHAAVPGADDVEAALALVERWAAGGDPPAGRDPFLPAVHAALAAGKAARPARLAALAALGLDPELDDSYGGGRAREAADAAAGTPLRWAVAAEPAADAVWFLAIMAHRVLAGWGVDADWLGWSADTWRLTAAVLSASGEYERAGGWDAAERRVALAVEASLGGGR